MNSGGMTGLLTRAPHQSHVRADAGQARQLATAAYLAVSVTGDLSAAEALLADARRACPEPVLSAETALATALVLLHGDGDVAAAHHLLLRGMEAARQEDAGSFGPEEVLWGLVTVCQVSGRTEHYEALRRLMTGPSPVVPASLHPAVALALDPRTAASRLDGDAGALVYQADPAQIVRTASAAVGADRLSDCRQALRRAARVQAGETAGPPALQAGILLALEAYQTGQWDEAWRLADTAAGVCASRGYQLLRRQAQTVLAFVAASRGDAETAQGLADEIVRWAAPREITSLLAAAHYAYALVALGQSDFPAAYQQAARISPAGDLPARAPFAGWAHLDLVEAALRTDRQDEAAARVRAVGPARLAVASPRLALLSAAALALTAPDDEARALFEQALAGEGTGRWPFDRARVQLLYGERLRRMKAVTAARVHLGAALEEFRRLGAATWAERAAGELRAAGVAQPDGDRCAPQVLSPQQLEIARLAAAGLSNKQIGERLFMSHRTVASHLYRAFPKLGITSRAALGLVLPRAGD